MGDWDEEEIALAGLKSSTLTIWFWLSNDKAYLRSDFSVG
jgi:hypothetical protein